MNSIEWTTAAFVFAALLTTAALLRTFVPAESGRIKRASLFCIVYLIFVALNFASSELGWAETEKTTQVVAFVLNWIVAIEITALIVFKLILPKIGFSPPSIIGDLSLGVAFIVLIVITLRKMGVDATGIAATSAVVTGVLAIGLQATLGNVIGGVALQLDRSIRVGDWIQIENGMQGRVQEIRWRHTVLETRDWDTIIVPNASLLAANIIILGKREGQPLLHRMWVYFNVDFRSRPADVISVVEKALQAPPSMQGVASQPKPSCICLNFADDNRASYAIYAVRYFLSDIAEDDPTSSIVRQRLYAALKRGGIPLAIPATLFKTEDSEDQQRLKLDREIERRIRALKKIEFLNMLNDEELKHIANGLQPVIYATNENIMAQGDESDWLYILTKGSVEVHISVKDKDRHVADLFAPDFFGEMGLMTGAPRGATVVATSEVNCYRLYRDIFEDVIQGRPTIAHEISNVLATRQIETQSIQQELDADMKNRRINEESGRLLKTISSFFGLSH